MPDREAGKVDNGGGPARAIFEAFQLRDSYLNTKDLHERQLHLEDTPRCSWRCCVGI